MAKIVKKASGPQPIDSLRHKDKRKNIPTEELRDFVAADENEPKTVLYPRDPSLDPQLVWKGKDEQDSKDLEVPAVPIYIQEKIHPQAIIEDFRRTAQKAPAAADPDFGGLFNDFNGLSDFDKKVDFYHHDQNWSKRYGKLTVLAARMNPDLAMGDELLKKTGAGNLFMVFGEPDVVVTSDQWLVTSGGRSIIRLHDFALLSGVAGLAEINRLGREDLQFFKELPDRGALRADQPASAGGGVGAVQHRRGSGTIRDGRVSPVPGRGAGIAGGSGDTSDPGDQSRNATAGSVGGASVGGAGDRADAERLNQIIAVQSLITGDLPLGTRHYAQVTIHGVDVYDPTTGEIRSNSTDDIACWFIDTDYNGESFFVRHAYFTGADEPYEKLKKALRAEIDETAWSKLYSTISRPFPVPASGKIAVKVINHYGDEVLKVYAVVDK